MKTIALPLAAILALSACSGGEEEPVEARPVASMEIGAESQDANTGRNLPARIRAANRTMLSFEVGGVVTRMNADLGDRVGRGAVLAQLDGTTYRLQVSQARAQIAEAEARLAQARQEADRQEALFPEGATSEMRLENARAQYGSLQAIVAANRDQARIAQEALSDTRLRTPFSGNVARRLVEPGTQVSPGQPIYELDGDVLEVVFAVSSDIRDALQVGTVVEVRSGDGEGTVRSARVIDIASRASGPGSFEIVAALGIGQQGFEPGQPAQVTLPEALNSDETDTASITVPLTAIMPIDENVGQVWVIGDDSTIAAREVRLGAITEQSVRIVSGLRRGEVIVTKGVAFLEAGEEVSRIGVGARRFSR